MQQFGVYGADEDQVFVVVVMRTIIYSYNRGQSTAQKLPTPHRPGLCLPRDSIFS